MKLGPHSSILIVIESVFVASAALAQVEASRVEARNAYAAYTRCVGEKAREVLACLDEAKRVVRTHKSHLAIAPEEKFVTDNLLIVVNSTLESSRRDFAEAEQAHSGDCTEAETRFGRAAEGFAALAEWYPSRADFRKQGTKAGRFADLESVECRLRQCVNQHNGDVLACLDRANEVVKDCQAYLHVVPEEKFVSDNLRAVTNSVLDASRKDRAKGDEEHPEHCEAAADHLERAAAGFSVLAEWNPKQPQFAEQAREARELAGFESVEGRFQQCLSTNGGEIVPCLQEAESVFSTHRGVTTPQARLHVEDARQRLQAAAHKRVESAEQARDQDPAQAAAAYDDAARCVEALSTVDGTDADLRTSAASLHQQASGSRVEGALPQALNKSHDCEQLEAAMDESMRLLAQHQSTFGADPNLAARVHKRTIDLVKGLMSNAQQEAKAGTCAKIWHCGVRISERSVEKDNDGTEAATIVDAATRALEDRLLQSIPPSLDGSDLEPPFEAADALTQLAAERPLDSTRAAAVEGQARLEAFFRREAEGANAKVAEAETLVKDDPARAQIDFDAVVDRVELLRKKSSGSPLAQRFVADLDFQGKESVARAGATKARISTAERASAESDDRGSSHGVSRQNGRSIESQAAAQPEVGTRARNIMDNRDAGCTAATARVVVDGDAVRRADTCAEALMLLTKVIAQLDKVSKYCPEPLRSLAAKDAAGSRSFFDSINAAKDTDRCNALFRNTEAEVARQNDGAVSPYARYRDLRGYKRGGAEAAAQAAVQPAPEVPPVLHPRDLLKNPFQFRGQAVVLDPASYPSVMNGAVLGWNPPVPSFGWAGLRFNRMLSENEALFDIMEVDVLNHTAGAPQFAGQILVKAGTFPGASGDAPLSMQRPWVVEPSGTTEGTNALGGRMTVPTVTFVRYR